MARDSDTVRTINDYKIVVDSEVLGNPMTIAVQHSGNPQRSTGLMFFSNWGEILLSISDESFADVIIHILKLWKGRYPEKFQEIKTLIESR